MPDETTKHRRRWSVLFYAAAIITLACIVYTVNKFQDAWQEDTRLARLLLSAIASSKTGLVQTNANMEIVGWSKSMEEMTGWRASDVMKSPLSSYFLRGFPEGHDERAIAAFKKARDSANVHRIMVVSGVMIGRHGERISVRVRTYMVPGKDLIISLFDKAAAVEVHP